MTLEQVSASARSLSSMECRDLNQSFLSAYWRILATMAIPLALLPMPLVTDTLAGWYVFKPWFTSWCFN